MHTYFIKWLKAGMAVFILGLKKTSICDVGAFVKIILSVLKLWLCIF